MGKKEVDVMIEGGKATAAPPLGPALGPLGVNITHVVDEINKKTKDMEGMKVPVKVIVDIDTKKFEIVVGTPPVSALIKKEVNIEKGSPLAGNVRAANLNMEQIKKIARMKFGSDENRFLKQIIGTARSMGISVNSEPLTDQERRKYIEELRKVSKKAQ